MIHKSVNCPKCLTSSYYLGEVDFVTCIYCNHKFRVGNFSSGASRTQAQPNPPDPWHKVIDGIIQLHNRKKEDYANEDQFSNFKESAEYAGVTIEQAINVLIGTKIARLRNLRESGKVPNNESIADTEIDLANYIIILHAWRLKNSKTSDNASSPAS